MDSSKKIVSAALVSILALVSAHDALAKKDSPMEKCYGIVKAGKNDCGTATGACAAQSKVSGAADAWIYLPKGDCDKILNGSTNPPKSASSVK